MNIFKILAQGDGKINEPNVSAFLGYLLNPNEDHGLGSRFLEPFLEQHCVQAKENSHKYNLEWLYKEKRIEDLSTNSDYEVNVFFEQAFGSKKSSEKLEESDSGKQVVDIFLVIHEVKKQQRETYFKNYLLNERTLKHIFLIEVKIFDIAVKLKNDKKGKEAQLTEQVKNSQHEIEKLLKDKTIKITNKDISLIFVTPQEEDLQESRAYKAFDGLKKEYRDLHSSHIFWNTLNDENEVIDAESETDNREKDNIDDIGTDSEGTALSIEQMIDNIIKPQPEVKSEPLPQYTIDTLQSFSNFIYSGFSYKQKRPKVKRKREVFENIENYFQKYESNLDIPSNDLIREFTAFIKRNHTNLYIRHSETHVVTISFKPKGRGKLFSLTKSGSKVGILGFVLRHLKNKKETYESLNKILSEKDYELKEYKDKDKHTWSYYINGDFDFEKVQGIFESYFEIIEPASKDQQG